MDYIILNPHSHVFYYFFLFSSFSDRTCTVINVEGDAYGAGLLQYFVDRTSKKEGVELSKVRVEEEDPASRPESSPLIEKQGNFELEEIAGPKPCDKESVM